ncbi:mucin-5AC-like [Haliotis rufescens]|uniref:mucin-5AC-like n=1 Tax=Haliotis rufescens TaxID=6454 RepID=UPI00201F39CC|nr:mucin-5AC-like [Haliotis rufescens]XP_048244008.1 mucin-5AC-like [Haliotis rufescens]XP_048244009.1 mucin-5AC-like [Haliotis rufescens]XP_048244010.1 mucin-5AC-like [Haliotis rufescens]
MAVHTGIVCLWLLTVCGANEQILSASVNVNTSRTTLENTSLTNQASRSFNPQLVASTSALPASQTSGPPERSALTSSLTPRDYGIPVSDSVTSDYTYTQQNILPSHDSLSIFSSSVQRTEMSQMIQDSSHVSVFPVTSFVDGVASSTPLLQDTSTIVSQSSPSHHISDKVTQTRPFSTEEHLVLSSFTEQMVTTVQPERFNHVVSSSQLISSSNPLNVTPNMTPLITPMSTESVFQSLQSSFQPSMVAVIPSATPEQTTVLSQIQQAVLSTQELSTVTGDMSSGWGRFLDRESVTQIQASSQTDTVSSQPIPLLSPTSSVIPASSSEVVTPPVYLSTQTEVQGPDASSNIVRASETEAGSQMPVMTTESSAVTGASSRTQTSQIVQESASVFTDPTTESVSVSESVSTSVAVSGVLSVEPSATSQPGLFTSVTSQSQEYTSDLQVSSSSSTVGETTERPTVSTSGEISPESVAPSSTTVPWSQQTTSTFVMPSQIVSSTSSAPMYSSSIIPSAMPATTTIKTTTPTSNLKDCYFELTFDVDCFLILNNSLVMAEFVGSLENVLVINLNVTKKQIKLYDPQCGSVIIHVGLMQVPHLALRNKLFAQFRQRQFEVPIMINNQWLKLPGLKVTEIDPPASTFSPIDPPDTGLDKVDLIVIIVACCICGILITIGVILCGKECWKRKYAQSFDLLEVPHVNLKLEDFTLTRIPRPKAVYNEEAVTMQGYVDNSSQRIVKNCGHQVTNGNGVHSKDIHVRMKQNRDGLVVGVTGYTAQTNGVSDKAAKRNSSVCNEASHQGDPATENLLKNTDRNTAMGATNPIFVDDENLTGDQTQKE